VPVEDMLIFSKKN